MGKWGRWSGIDQNFSYNLNNDKVLKFIKWLKGERDDSKDGKKNRGRNNEADDDDWEDSLDSNVDIEMERGKHNVGKKEKAETDEDGYMTFKIPWSLSIGYTVSIRENTDVKKFNYNTMRYPYKLTQTLNFSGSVQISDGWNISYTSGYDFVEHAISMTTVQLSRDLHCFNMACQMTLAPYTSYNFSFRCNASTLTDALKYDKRSGSTNAVQWY